MQIDITTDGYFILAEGNYSIRIPPSLAGLHIMYDMLKARRRGETKLAQPGAPAQSNIPELIAAKLKEIRERPPADLPIDTKGLDL